MCSTTGREKKLPVAHPVHRAGSSEIIVAEAFTVGAVSHRSVGMIWMNVPEQDSWRKGLNGEGLNVKEVWDP